MSDGDGADVHLLGTGGIARGPPLESSVRGHNGAMVITLTWLSRSLCSDLPESMQEAGCLSPQETLSDRRLVKCFLLSKLNLISFVCNLSLFQLPWKYGE